MKRFFGGLTAAGLAVLTATLGLAQELQPPAQKAPDAETRKQINAKIAELEKTIKAVRDKKLPDAYLTDLEVYQEAAESILRHNEFFQPEYSKWTLAVLDRGLK